MAVSINGTTGISGVDGSASAPALQGTDSNTGINFASDTVNINTGGSTRATIDSSGALDVPSNFPIKVAGSEKLRIDSSGNVGIGTTSPDHGRLTLSQSASSAFNALVIQQGNTGSSATDGLHIGIDSNVDAYIFHKESRALEFGTANTERMRIDSDGNVGIGNVSPNYLFTLQKSGTNLSRFYQLNNNQGDSYASIEVRHAAALSGQNGQGIIFKNSGGTKVGRIDIGQSTTGYVTSSDYRLKENATAISDGITRLKTLKPYQFNWIAEKGQPKVDGFFAHEVTAVPEAISGTKDEVTTTYYQNEDTIPEGKAVGDVKSTNSPVYQGIDQSKLVPLLTAALQEAIAKIEVLETKVAALEAG